MINDDLFDLPEQRKPVKPLWVDDLMTSEDGEGRIPDWRLAELLGFSYNPEIKRLIARHEPALLRFGTLWHRDIKSTGGRPGTEYRLNRKQAIYIVGKSETENAVELQILIVEVFDAYLSGKVRPADAETEVRLADAADRAIDTAPELMQQLYFDFTARVAGVDNKQIQLERRVDGIDDRLGEVEKQIGAKPSPTPGDWRTWRMRRPGK